MKMLISVKVDEFDINFMGAHKIIAKIYYIAIFGDIVFHFCTEYREYDNTCQYIAVKIKRPETDEEERLRQERDEYERLTKNLE